MHFQIDSQMTVATVLWLMSERSHVQCHAKWGLVEFIPELNIERSECFWRQNFLSEMTGAFCIRYSFKHLEMRSTFAFLQHTKTKMCFLLLETDASRIMSDFLRPFFNGNRNRKIGSFLLNGRRSTTSSWGRNATCPTATRSQDSGMKRSKRCSRPSSRQVGLWTVL